MRTACSDSVQHPTAVTARWVVMWLCTGVSDVHAVIACTVMCGFAWISDGNDVSVEEVCTPYTAQVEAGVPVLLKTACPLHFLTLVPALHSCPR